MSLLTSIVDLESIQVNLSAVPFNPDEQQTQLEALAHTITQLKGLLRIPVVKRLGIDEYELVAGYLEYFAFVKAREIDPSLPDRISVFILKPDNEEAILKQLQASEIVQQLSLTEKSAQTDSTAALQINNLELRIERHATIMSAAIEDLKSIIGNLQSEVLTLKTELQAADSSRVPFSIQGQSNNQLLPIEAFNRIPEPAVQQQVLRKLSPLGKTKATKIVEMLVEYKQHHTDVRFERLSDVQRVLKKGTLSLGALQEIAADWND